jgi:hypothetical protein
VTELRDDGLASMVAGLEARSGHLGEVLACTHEAIAALRKLQTACTVAAALPAPPAPRALPPARPADTETVDHHGHRVHGETRPRAAVCKNERCGKEFEVRAAGRLPHYCSDACRTAVGKRAKRSPEPDAPATPPEPIPESGDAMRARIRQALKGDGPAPRSRFLETVRGRNDAAAKRNAARPS